MIMPVYFQKDFFVSSATRRDYFSGIGGSLTLKAPITTAADDCLGYFFIYFFFDKIMLDISCECSACQRIHMKHQALFSSKDKSKNNKSVVCCNFAWHFKG